MNCKRDKDSNKAWCANLARLCAALLIVAVFATSATGVIHNGFAVCQGGFTYLVEADSGGYYVLVGLPSDLRSQYANHTTRISVSGTYYPSNPNQYLYPNPNLHGLIYVTQYVINGVTFSSAQTVVMVSGTVTKTSTYTNQISATTMTAVTGVVTLSPIRVSGWLDYTPEYCITTLLTTASSGSSLGNIKILGFTALPVILGLMIGLSILGIRRYSRKRESRNGYPAARVLG